MRSECVAVPEELSHEPDDPLLLAGARDSREPAVTGRGALVLVRLEDLAGTPCVGLAMV
jgi:hypothetical protein